MFGPRRYRCAIASVLAVLASSAPGLASDSLTVIVTSNTADARLTSALVLIRGELSALGVTLQVRNQDATGAAAAENSAERLSLELNAGAIVVRVFAAGAQAPVVESVELDGPEVTAEVIAVRAVEALRAARLLPTPPQRAVEAKPAAKPTEPRPSPKATPVEAAPEPASRTATAGPVPLFELALGPAFVQNPQGLPQLTLHLALSVGPSWGFVRVGAEGSLGRQDFERNAGSAQISRRMAFLQLGARARLHRAWEVNARTGVSYLRYETSGVAKPGYLAQELEHGTGGVSLSLGGAYYFARTVGVYLDVGGLVAFDAARVRLADESVVTLDQPSVSIGFGLLLGAF